LNTKNKNIIVTVILFFIVLILLLTTLFLNRESRINIILDAHSSTLQNYYEILQYNQKILADISFEETMQETEFIEIFTKANKAKKENDTQKLNSLRKDAINLLDIKYKLFRKKGVLQYHFVFPDNVCFLRMHKTSKYGDDLSGVRSDFNYANTNLKSIRGFAQGRTAHAFRNVYPVFNKEKEHIGAMEISFSSDLLQNYFTQVNKLHTHFLVRKDIFKSHAWKRDDLVLQYQPSSEHANFMITMTNDHTKEKCIVENSKRVAPITQDIFTNMKKGEKFSLYVIYEGKARVTSFFPVKHNITKEPVAWIVSYKKDPLIDKTIVEFNYIMIFATFILILLFGFLYYILNQKVLLDLIVDEKTKNLQDTYRELEESEDELKILNETLVQRVDEEVEKNRKKDKVLFEQTKMAALGEMIGNIAHQWRQPLSVISTASTGMKLQQELGTLDSAKIVKTCSTINENAQYLSKTIDDFSRFIKGESKKEPFNLYETVQEFLSFVNGSIKKYQIMVKIEIAKDIEVDGFKNELNQCLINLFNNSKDALLFTEPLKLIHISAYREDDQFVLNFKDNGGGISEKIIGKVFEPYFTTKHQSQGTGLGLNMTYRLIVEGMQGSISVANETFSYEDQKYTGAKFTIKLPIA
jgi:two-component system, NtrC family, C4-dicarboxylate transport sensor histidine kinase DctB